MIRNAFAHDLFDVENLAKALDKPVVMKEIEKNCEFMWDYYKVIKKIMYDVPWHEHFAADVPESRKRNSEQQREEQLSKNGRIQFIFVIGKEDRKKYDWRQVNGNYPAAEVLFLKRSLTDRYMNQSLSNDKFRTLKNELCLYMDEALKTRRIDQTQCVVVMQSTDYKNQTELLKALRQRGYEVKGMRVANDGQVSLLAI